MFSFTDETKGLDGRPEPRSGRHGLVLGPQPLAPFSSCEILSCARDWYASALWSGRCGLFVAALAERAE